MIAERGWALITGGRNEGVMNAANDGAKTAKDSLTIGILPNRITDVARAVDVAIITDVGEARNNIIVLSADVVIACGVDDAGTASEVALAIKNGKPVVLLGPDTDAAAFFDRIGNDQVHTAAFADEALSIAAELLSGQAR